MTDSISVAIAEDSAMLRDGLVQLLVDRGFEVTEAVSEPQKLQESIARDCPDVAVIDIRMPPTFTDEGLRVAIELRRRHPALGILLFSQYIETRYAADYWLTEPPASVTSSRTGWPTGATSSKRSCG